MTSGEVEISPLALLGRNDDVWGVGRNDVKGGSSNDVKGITTEMTMGGNKKTTRGGFLFFVKFFQHQI